MQLSFSMRVVALRDVLVQELDGEAVFLNLDGGRYFSLDAVGTRMWQVLTTAGTIQSAYDSLLAEYEVEPERLRQDLQRLIEQLAEHGLVEVVGE